MEKFFPWVTEVASPKKKKKKKKMSGKRKILVSGWGLRVWTMFARDGMVHDRRLAPGGFNPRARGLK
jgi:hypothetical protein